MLPFDPAIPFLVIYLKEVKHPYRKTYTQLFIAALLTVAKMWEPPKCLSTDEWINKIWHIHTMEYYLAIKRKVLIYAIKQVN